MRGDAPAPQPLRLAPLEKLVATHGLNALDHRSAPVRALFGWRGELTETLGGASVVTPQQEALVDLAVRARLFVDHVPMYVLETVRSRDERHRRDARMDKRVEDRRVGDVMTRTPTCVQPQTDLRTLKAMFESHDFNAFPVLDEDGALLGIVTKLDFLKMFRPDRRRWIPDLRSLWAERAGDIMTRGVVTVTPEDPIATAVDRMVQSSLRSLPVVERRGGQHVLVGIVSRRDVLGALMLEGDACN